MFFQGELVGYIQMYDLRKYDYSAGANFNKLPKKLAGIDIFLGEVKVLGKG